jgi:hypothetical protein
VGSPFRPAGRRPALFLFMTQAGVAGPGLRSLPGSTEASASVRFLFLHPALATSTRRMRVTERGECSSCPRQCSDGHQPSGFQPDSFQVSPHRPSPHAQARWPNVDILSYRSRGWLAVLCGCLLLRPSPCSGRARMHRGRAALAPSVSVCLRQHMPSPPSRSAPYLWPYSRHL